MIGLYGLHRPFCDNTLRTNTLLTLSFTKLANLAKHNFEPEGALILQAQFLRGRLQSLCTPPNLSDNPIMLLEGSDR
ncbi:hypothetical protein DPMN_075202 [Dreissena polymorpha]|uniref:Uncharacterized protein n=1 Tax=Dreissena polymorpha TaxID=45954 RepID=A0A9D4BEP6_DREPO|nr:hypothetical protein DPMN_075202 [Dreissena polymorpha]